MIEHTPATASVAVIIVNYNGGKHLRRAVASVTAQTVKPQRLIVIDNGSTDGSLEGCEAACPWVEIHRLGRNSGFAEGNNIGVKLAQDCEWIALLNPDAFAEPDWIEQLMAAARGSEFSVFACRLLRDHDPTILDGAGDAYRRDGIAWPRFQGWRVGSDGDSPYEVFGPCGAAALYPRAAYLEVGGFDENYFCYHEDVDLAFRLRLAGYRCQYLPQAVARHVGSAVSGWGSDFSVYHANRNMVWTFIKNMPTAQLWLYLPSHACMALFTLLRFMTLGRPRVILRAKLHALRGLPRVLRQRREIQRRRKITPAKLAPVLERANPLASAAKRLIERARRTKQGNVSAIDAAVNNEKN